MEGADLRELPLGARRRLERSRGRQGERQSTPVVPLIPSIARGRSGA